MVGNSVAPSRWPPVLAVALPQLAETLPWEEASLVLALERLVTAVSAP